MSTQTEKRLLIPFAEVADAGGPNFREHDHDEWLCAAGTHRDADCLARSNFRTMLKLLGGESSFVSILRMSHWAVGWTEYLLIKPTARVTIKRAQTAREAMENYPVLDEEDFSNLEWEDFESFADSELKTACPHWRDLAHADDNLQVGDDSSEWKFIERIKQEYADHAGGEDSQ